MPLHDGGELVGGYCPHNRTIAVLRHRPDGSVLPWRMESPTSEADLHELMALIAASVHRVAEDVEALRKAREAGLN